MHEAPACRDASSCNHDVERGKRAQGEMTRCFRVHRHPRRATVRQRLLVIGYARSLEGS
ncbi:Hypothetical protein A7982_05539 [Minicystis rosea]|nr:Hypothetical protein A7982_05539 [Minicystis rosea]